MLVTGTLSSGPATPAQMRHELDPGHEVERSRGKVARISGGGTRRISKCHHWLWVMGLPPEKAVYDDGVLMFIVDTIDNLQFCVQRDLHIIAYCNQMDYYSYNLARFPPPTKREKSIYEEII